MKTLVTKINLALALTLAIVYTSSSQEIGIIGSKYWTNNSELQNPLGFGIYLSKDFSTLFSIKLNYEYLANERIYEGVTGTGILGENAVQEKIKSSSRANLWKLSFAIVPLDLELLRFYTGLALSSGSFSADKHGQQTGKKVSSLDGQKFGAGFFFNIKTPPFKIIPIVITVNVSRDYFGTSSMATDIETPFSQKMTTTNLQICLGYVLK